MASRVKRTADRKLSCNTSSHSVSLAAQVDLRAPADVVHQDIKLPESVKRRLQSLLRIPGR
jgi:hypothetical protein